MKTLPRVDLYLITTNLILFSIRLLNLITKKTVLVTSTINVPFFLEGICDNAKKYNFNDYSILVIGDVKTPVEAKQYCRKLSKKFKNELFYLDIKDQENYLEEFKDIFDFIPLNNNARKMIGTILAFVNGCERVIMIDDDNYATEKNFFKYHLITGKTQKLKLVESSDGWFNIAECMIEKKGTFIIKNIFCTNDKCFICTICIEKQLLFFVPKQLNLSVLNFLG